jgi:hypothetical protein
MGIKATTEKVFKWAGHISTAQWALSLMLPAAVSAWVISAFDNVSMLTALPSAVIVGGVVFTILEYRKWLKSYTPTPRPLIQDRLRGALSGLANAERDASCLTRLREREVFDPDPPTVEQQKEWQMMDNGDFYRQRQDQLRSWPPLLAEWGDIDVGDIKQQMAVAAEQAATNPLNVVMNAPDALLWQSAPSKQEWFVIKAQLVVLEKVRLEAIQRLSSKPAPAQNWNEIRAILHEAQPIE